MEKIYINDILLLSPPFKLEEFQTVWQIVYKQFAEDMNNALEDQPNAANGEKYVYNSLLTLIDMDSTDIGVAATVELLKTLYYLYLYTLKHPHRNEDQIRKFVRKVNIFTIQNFGDLTTFVNGITWEEDCLPYYWWQLSEDLGFDVSEWIKCSS